MKEVKGTPHGSGPPKTPDENVIRLPLMTFPDYQHLSLPVQHDMLLIERLFALAVWSDARVEALLECSNVDIKSDHFASGLRHRLSSTYRHLNPSRHYVEDRSLVERSACSVACKAAPIDIWFNRDRLDQLIIDVAALTRGNAALRGELYGEKDGAGYRAQFPPEKEVSDQLNMIVAFVQRNIAAYPAFAAIGLMGGLFNIHPIRDGNGRLGRTLFNSIMQDSSGNAFYLPLYELAAASSGGWLVALRELHLNSDWSGVATFIKTGLLVFAPP